MKDTSDLELAIVGGLMIDDTKAHNITNKLHETHFKNHLARTIFNAMVRLVSREMPIDATLVCSVIMRNEFDGVSEKDVYYVACNAPSPKNIDAYVFELNCHRKEDGTLEKPIN